MSAAVWVTEVAVVLVLVLVGGWIGAVAAGTAAGAYLGVVIGLLLGLALAVIPWRGQPLWSWVQLWLRRNRTFPLAEPVTVANDGSGGGVRCQAGQTGGVATVAVHVLGRLHAPTVFTGSASTYTENTLNITDLQAMLTQSLDLSINSLSVVTTGARRREAGDYPRVYDTMIGPPPYAGQRETWLIARISLYDNADGLRYRPTAGTTAVAAAQRIAASLRRQNIRARVGTATEIVELERRLGSTALQPDRRQWRSLRGESGWLTTYWYRSRDIDSEVLSQAWAMRVDSVTQNITLFADGTATATVTVTTAQPPDTPPAVILGTLNGEQSAALAANMCGPLPQLRGIRPGPLPERLTIPIGPSGVLLGKVGAADRLMLPLTDPAEFSRIHLAADEHLAKRLIIRAAGAGERVTVHTDDVYRWASVRMPGIVVTDRPRPAAGTTISVVAGGMSPAPRPNTVITIETPGTPPRGHADVVINQVGPAHLEVTVGGRAAVVEMELFRAENRYVSSEPMSMMSSSSSTTDSSHR